MRFLHNRVKPHKPDHSTALVVFRCSGHDAAALDVAVGPCVARISSRGGRLRPFASPLDQLYTDTLDTVASLYTVVSGRSAVEAVDNRRTVGPGTIASLSQRFVTSLLSLAANSTDHDEILREYRNVAERWLAAVAWPAGMQLGGVEMRILSWTGVCKLANEKGLGVYSWRGPSVPMYVIAHGVGPESYEAYRRSKRR